jgi:hypothetical protein
MQEFLTDIEIEIVALIKNDSWSGWLSEHEILNGVKLGNVNKYQVKIAIEDLDQLGLIILGGFGIQKWRLALPNEIVNKRLCKSQKTKK